MAEPVLGIDFGTGSCRIAVSGDTGKSRTTARLLGGKDAAAFPSVVGLGAGGQWLAGREAADAGAVNPSGVVHGAKRLLGLQAGEAAEWCRELWGGPPVAAGRGGAAMVGLEGYGVSRGEARPIWPSEAAIQIFRHVKNRVHSVLGIPVNLCVVGVPPVVGPAQREMVAQAARLAGLEVLGLLDEGLAVALWRASSPWFSGGARAFRETLLIADAGEGFTSITAVSRIGSRYRVLAVAESPQNGHVVTRRVAEWLIGEMSRQPGWPLAPSPNLLARVWELAKQAKEEVSKADVYPAVLPFAGRSFSVLVTRSQVERLSEEYVRCLKEAAEWVWASCEGATGPIERDLAQPAILPSGGQARAPFVIRALGGVGGRAKVHPPAPDGAVALGAALWGQALVEAAHGQAQAAEAVRAAGRADRYSRLMRISPWSIAAGPEGNESVLVSAGATLPCEATLGDITTTEDGQDRAVLKLSLSKPGRPKGKTPLGEVRFAALTPAPAGTQRIRLALAVAADGRLSARAQDAADKTVVTTLHYAAAPRDQDLEAAIGGLKGDTA